MENKEESISKYYDLRYMDIDRDYFKKEKEEIILKKIFKEFCIKLKDKLYTNKSSSIIKIDDNINDDKIIDMTYDILNTVDGGSLISKDPILLSQYRNGKKIKDTSIIVYSFNKPASIVANMIFSIDDKTRNDLLEDINKKATIFVLSSMIDDIKKNEQIDLFDINNINVELTLSNILIEDINDITRFTFKTKARVYLEELKAPYSTTVTTLLPSVIIDIGVNDSASVSKKLDKHNMTTEELQKAIDEIFYILSDR